MNHKIKSFLLIIISLIFIACDRGDNTLIKINSHAVPVSRFYQSVHLSDLKALSDDQIRNKISDFAQEELMVFDAYKINLHKDKLFIEQMDYFKRNALISEYLQRTVVDSIISESYLLHKYAGLNQRFRDAHPYSMYRERLLEMALSDNRTVIQNALYDHMENTANQYSLLFNDSILAALSESYNDTFRVLYAKNHPDVSPLLVLGKIGDKRTVARTKTRSYSLPWLVEEVRIRRIDVPFGLISPELFKNIFKTLIVEDIFYRSSLKNKYDRSSRFLSKLEEYQRSLLLSNYKSKMIYDVIDTNDDSIKTYYLRNQHTRYSTTSRAEIIEIFIRDSVKAVEILRAALHSKDFAALAKKNTERLHKQNRPGYLGIITAEQYGGIGKLAQLLKPGEVYNQLIRSGDGYSIIKSLAYFPPEPKPFESVKHIVIQDYSDERAAMISDSLISVLKLKYRTKIYFENLKANLN